MTTNLTKKPLLSPRRQRSHDAMIQKILEAARGIMRENGVAGLTMQELARRMEMRAPSLYYYFSGLMDVYDSLFRLGFNLWDEHIQNATQNAQTWQEEIRQVMEAYMSFALENPDLYQLCFERPVPGFVPSDESLALSFRILRQGYSRTARYAEELQSGLPAEQTADLIIALMHGLTALHMANEPHLPLGEGRFGSLIPAALTLLSQAWSKQSSS